MDNIQLKETNIYNIKSNIQLWKYTILNNMFNGELIMDNLNIYKGEIYPITMKISATDINYNNFIISDAVVEVHDNAGNKLNTYDIDSGAINIDTSNGLVIYNWDTNEYIEGQYIIVIWVDILYNEKTSRLCSGNISKVIRPINLLLPQHI